jgi:ferritin-like metal-binding protein YciE
MGLFTNIELNSLEDLLVDQLKDLYDAEHRLTEALPKMAEASYTPALRQAFLSHLEQTKNHVLRLDQAFADLGQQPERETCQAMKGLISEGSQVIDAKGDSIVKDAALIAAAQRVEHYEMAGYGSARTFAQQLNLPNVAALLQRTLDEEGAADQKLTELAISEINAEAARTTAARV